MSGTSDRPARSRWVISLRVLMVLIVGLSIGIAWLTNRARSQRDAVAAILSRGGQVMFDYQFDTSNSGTPVAPLSKRNAEPHGPKWLRRIVGDEYFREVVRVILPQATSPRATWVGPVDSPPDLVMRFVGTLTSVKILTINREQATDEGFNQIRSLKNLEILWIDAEDLTDAGFAAIRGMTRLQLLQVLNAKHLTDTGASCLAGLKNLTELRIDKSEISDKGLAYLKGLTHLEKLILPGDRITDHGLAQLKELTRLSSLVLVSDHITDHGLAHLKELTRLESLVLSSPEITDDGLAYLKNLTRLQTLWLRYSSSIAGPGLSHLSGLPRLTRLFVKSDKLTDDGLAYLEGLPRLVDLHLDSPNITDNGLVHLEGLVRLEGVFLSGPHITEEGLAHLATMKTLKNLGIENAGKFSDSALDQLAGLVNLRFLQIECKDKITNQITDRGLEVLKQLPQLKLAIINGPKISQGTIQRLQKARPGLRIWKTRPRPPDTRPAGRKTPAATPSSSRAAS